MLSAAYILVSGPLIPSGTILKALYLASIAFALWAVIEMKFRFSVFPSLLPGKELVTTGPYSIVRHPMYTSIMAAGLILVAENTTFARLIAWFLLAAVLILKSRAEDRVLESEFDSYKEYESKRRSIIPFVY